MFRRTSGAMLCPSCGRLTGADARACPWCGRRNPGLWGWAGPLRALTRWRSFTDVVTVACVALYIGTLVVDPAGWRPAGAFGVLAPTVEALLTLGAAGSGPWAVGRWWTLVTGIYLHGGPLHLLFNVLWVRQLGPAVEELYGPARLVVIFTVAGAAGFAVSNAFNVPLTVGASGSIFGLLGAMVAFGRKRGGTFGAMVLRQYGLWAGVLFVFGLLPGSAANNWAHAGGFVAGFVAGLGLSLAERRSETLLDQVLAAGCLAVSVLALLLALWTGFVGG